MAPQKMSCKNDAKYMYTGKEMSPMGLGYCADAEMVGKKMLGRDGKDWIVGTKNGIKIWQRAPDSPLVHEEPVMKKNEITAVSDSEDNSDSDDDNKDDVINTNDDTVKPDDEEIKPMPAAPKKRGRPAKAKIIDEDNDDNKEVKPENGEANPADKEVKPKRKYVRKPKATEEANAENGEAKPVDKEVKPKRKYVRKVKVTDETVDANEPEKKVRKPRAKTEYNTFISEKLKELREKHKELKTTEYFKMAISEWKIYKENKNTVMEALNEEEVVA